MNISKNNFINNMQNTRSLLIVSGFMRKYQLQIGYLCDSSTQELVHCYILIYYKSRYKIYGIGRQESGEFGIGKHETQKNGYIRLHRFEEYLSSPFNIFRGKERLNVLSEDRKLYCAGFNERGECGVDSARYKITNLTQCTFKNTKKIFINLVSDGIWTNHTILQSSHADFYGFGINHHGEFGNNDKSYAFENIPRKLSYLTNFFKSMNIIKIATGFEHTLLLTSTGVLFSCGNNDIGQCGIDQDPTNSCFRYKQQPTPKMVMIHNRKNVESCTEDTKYDIECESVMDICCGEDFNLVLTKQHEIYVFGNNNNGQLGMGARSKGFYRTPTLHYIYNANNHNNDKYGKIVEIECGRLHSCVVNEEGIVFLFGYNGNGQIGNGRVNDWNDGIGIPHCFQRMHNNYSNLKIKQISLGSDHTVILTQNDNRIITFGGNQHRQCSPNDMNDTVLFPHFLQYDEIGLSSAELYERVIAGTKTTMIVISNNTDNVHYTF